MSIVNGSHVKVFFNTLLFKNLTIQWLVFMLVFIILIDNIFCFKYKNKSVNKFKNILQYFKKRYLIKNILINIIDKINNINQNLDIHISAIIKLDEKR